MAGSILSHYHRNKIDLMPLLLANKTDEWSMFLLEKRAQAYLTLSGRSRYPINIEELLRRGFQKLFFERGLQLVVDIPIRGSRESNTISIIKIDGTELISIIKRLNDPSKIIEHIILKARSKMNSELR